MGQAGSLCGNQSLQPSGLPKRVGPQNPRHPPRRGVGSVPESGVELGGGCWNCIKVMVQKMTGLSTLSLLAGSFSRLRCVSFTHPEAGLLPPFSLTGIRARGRNFCDGKGTERRGSQPQPRSPEAERWCSVGDNAVTSAH